MNDDQLNDLKQFIAATVSQATAELSKDIEIIKDDIEIIKDDLDLVKVKIDDLDLKVDTISEALHENLSEHDLRLIKLERQTT